MIGKMAKYQSIDEIARAISRRRFECGLELLTEREREEVYDEAFDGICEMQRHNC